MSKGKLLAICCVWLVIVVALAASYRFFISPHQLDKTMSGTSSSSNYKHAVNLALDSFSGYAILRSPQMQDELSKKRIRLNLSDDGADYGARMQSLQSGKVQMAVFTVDALLKESEKQGELPATIVAIIDETRGADAIVAYKQAIPNIDALNRADMKFVATMGSPSETLARVVMRHFHLDNLGPSPFSPAKDAEDVFRRYKAAASSDPKAFVLWEPYVTMVLENPKTHILTDSSQFRGYIVDVLVVNRDFLLKNKSVVLDVVGSYFRSAYHYRGDMVDLVYEDARNSGQSLTREQAKSITKGIWWKNTQENFAHFGLRSTKSIQLLEDMIDNVSRTLVTTGAMTHDPTNGRPTQLYFDQILKTLQSNDFHPGLSSESVRDDKIELSALSDEQWATLTPVGTLNVPRLSFARGTDRLTGSSQRTLDDLVNSLTSLPRAYVMVQGDVNQRGDLDANKVLAVKRADAASKYLIEAGVDSNRIHAQAGKPSNTSSVSFVLGQPPY